MKALFLLAAVVTFGMAVILLATAQHTALAEEPERAIPAMEVSSPASGQISVTWGAPSDTDSLTSYRISWAPWENGRLHLLPGRQLGHGRERLPRRAGVLVHDNGPGGRGVRGLRTRPVRRLPERTLQEVRQGGGGQRAGRRTHPGAGAHAGAGTHADTGIHGNTGAGPRGHNRPDHDQLPAPEHLYVSWNEAEPEPTEYRLNWAPVDQPFPAWNSNQGGNLWREGTALDFSNLVEPRGDLQAPHEGHLRERPGPPLGRPLV